MAKYVFIGATDYAKEILSVVSPDEIAFILDEKKSGTEILGKRVYTSKDMPPVTKDVEFVLFNVSAQDIQYLKDNDIPYLFPPQLLLKKEMFDSSLYPEPIKELLNTYGKTQFTKMTEEELREFSVQADKYKQFVIGVLHPTSIGGFAWTCGRFCEYSEKVKSQDTLLGVCKGWHPCMETHKKYSIPNEFLYKKMLKKFSEINEYNVNSWCTYLCGHLDKICVFSYWDAMSSTALQAQQFFSIENRVFPLVAPPKERIIFTIEEQRKGEEQAHKMGILRKYVCFFARDNAYIQETHKNMPTDTYSNSDKYRNTDLNLFKLMDKNLKKIGIQTVRMGSVVNNCYDGEGVDYPNLQRSDFMDNYLCSGCMFFIGDVSGINHIASEIFTKHIVGICPSTNLLFQGDVVGRTDLILPKSIYSRKSQRNIPLGEILEVSKRLNYFVYKYFSFWNMVDIEVVQPSAEDIWEAAKEMVNILNGTQRYTDEELELRNRYRLLICKHLENRNDLVTLQGYPSIAWLKKNKWFLE